MQKILYYLLISTESVGTFIDEYDRTTPPEEIKKQVDELLQKELKLTKEIDSIKFKDKAKKRAREQESNNNNNNNNKDNSKSKRRKISDKKVKIYIQRKIVENIYI